MKSEIDEFWDADGRNIWSDVPEVTSSGRMFQTLQLAIGNARLPTDVRRNAGTIRRCMEADLSQAA